MTKNVKTRSYVIDVHSAISAGVLHAIDLC